MSPLVPVVQLPLIGIALLSGCALAAQGKAGFDHSVMGEGKAAGRRQTPKSGNPGAGRAM